MVDGTLGAMWQGSLFGTGPLRPDAGPTGVNRHELGRGAWLDLGPSWLAGADDLFDRLVTNLTWWTREVVMYGRVLPEPRLGARWDLRQPPPGPTDLYDDLVTLAGALDARYRVGFDSVGCNFYRSGQDSVAFHADRHARQPTDPDAVVAIVSLGAPRRFLVRPKGGGRSLGFDLAAGDLLVMGGSFQRSWEHSIPKRAQAGPRISVTYRHPVR